MVTEKKQNPEQVPFFETESVGLPFLLGRVEWCLKASLSAEHGPIDAGRLQLLVEAGMWLKRAGAMLQDGGRSESVPGDCLGEGPHGAAFHLEELACASKQADTVLWLLAEALETHGVDEQGILAVVTVASELSSRSVHATRALAGVLGVRI